MCAEGGRPRILVLRGGAIGDFIVTLPALSLLRRRWPAAYVEVVGYPRVAELARLVGLADRITSLDRADMARWFSLKPQIAAEQADYVRSFDLILQYLYDPDGTVRRNMLAAGARQVIYASPVVRDCHAVEHLLRPLAALALYPDGIEAPELVLPPEALAAARARLARNSELGTGNAEGDRAAPLRVPRFEFAVPRLPVVAIHPGSGSPAKNWPFEGFLEVARRLRAERGLAAVFVLGDAEAEQREALRRAEAGFGVLSGLTVPELAAVLASFCCYVGNDSGITHLAAAVGTPTVALFGPTDPALWAPRGRRVRVLRAPDAAHGGWGELASQDVLAALQAVLNGVGA